ICVLLWPVNAPQHRAERPELRSVVCHLVRTVELGENPKYLYRPHVFRYSETVRELTASVVPCWWVSSIVSTRFRALPLLFCAFTSASTYVSAGPVVRPSTCYEIRSGDTAARL